MAQSESMLALGNGYLGMRGCPEESGPSAENSTLINGFHETWNKLEAQPWTIMSLLPPKR